MLLDLHPQPRLNPVDVATSAGTMRAGVLGYNDSFVSTIAAADQALAVLEAEGFFAREQQMEYEVLNHFDSAAQWRTYLEEQAEYYVAPDEAMLRTIDRAPGEVVMTEWIRGTRFRRLG